MAEKKLTPRQRKFVSGVLKGKSKTQAAIDAGYSKKTAPKNATRMTKNEGVSKAIEEGQKKRSERLELEEDYELKKLKELAEISSRHVENEEGEFNPGAANSQKEAIALIAKIRQKFTTKVEVNVSSDLSTRLSRINDD